MKEELNTLVLEMLNEVKNIKDLAKEELPQVALEYVNFKYYSSVAIALLLLAAIIVCLTLPFIFISENAENRSPIILIAAAIAVTLLILMLDKLYEAAIVKFMPKTTAIKAITRLIK